MVFSASPSRFQPILTAVNNNHLPASFQKFEPETATQVSLALSSFSPIQGPIVHSML